MGVTVLHNDAPHAKVAAAQQAVSALGKGLELKTRLHSPLPVRPARPEKPVSVPPNEVPKRRLGSPIGRATLLHAIAHIEFNAIDLAFDMAVRFAQQVEALGLDHTTFVADWWRRSSSFYVD